MTAIPPYSEKAQIPEPEIKFDPEIWEKLDHTLKIDFDLIASQDVNYRVRVIAEHLRTVEGLRSFMISFSGGGDSGQIDEFLANGDKFINPSSMPKLLEWAYDFLENTGIDYYNNDGGQGTLDFDLKTNQFVVDIDYYVTKTENALYEERDI